VTDTQSYTIRKITPSGSVTTFAGSPGLAGSHDDIGAEARFWAPTSIAVDSFDNIYVSDIVTPINSGGFYQVIRKITPAGAVTTLQTPPPVVAYANYWGQNIVVDDANQINRFYRSSLVRVSADGTRTTLVGNEKIQGYQDGISTEARFSTEGIYPRHLTIDEHGNIYTAYLNTIRKITRAGTVSTLAGSPNKYGLKDGVGKDARFYFPSSIAVDPSGQLYVTSGSTITKGQLAEAPLITTQPERLDVMTGGTVGFSVIVSSAPAPTYQWYINGQPFDGATKSTLSFTNARTSDAGNYTVVVTNELGSVTSDVAKLTVTAATTPSVPSSSSGGGGGGGAPSIWFLAALIGTVLSKFYRRSRI